MTRSLPASERYSTGAIAFHWSIAVLVIANLVIGIGHDAVPALRKLMGAHFAIGLTVLALTAGRVLWRLTHRPPPLPTQVAGWEKGAAHATHWTLYVLMVVMPLSGWLLMSGPHARGPISWFGLFNVPLLPASAGTSDTAHSAHTVLGWVMLALVVLHIAAALRHHLLLRDAVLARMAPGMAR